jgi:hypothetical protein
MIHLRILNPHGQRPLASGRRPAVLAGDATRNTASARRDGSRRVFANPQSLRSSFASESENRPVVRRSIRMADSIASYVTKKVAGTPCYVWRGTRSSKLSTISSSRRDHVASLSTEPFAEHQIGVFQADEVEPSSNIGDEAKTSSGERSDPSIGFCLPYGTSGSDG